MSYKISLFLLLFTTMVGCTNKTTFDIRIDELCKDPANLKYKECKGK